MSLAERLANQIAAEHGRDPWLIAEALELRVLRLPLPEPHRELYVLEHRSSTAGLIVSPSASTTEARELVAHGLAHHLLHLGDRVSGGSPAIWSGRHEREADDFAACLLIPRDALEAFIGEIDEPSLWEVSQHFGVTEVLAGRRMALLRRERETLDCLH